MTFERYLGFVKIPRRQVAAVLVLGLLYLGSILFYGQYELLILINYVSGLALALLMVLVVTRALDS